MIERVDEVNGVPHLEHEHVTYGGHSYEKEFSQLMMEACLVDDGHPTRIYIQVFGQISGAVL